MTSKWITAALLVSIAAPLGAQSDDAFAGALGIVLTPTGNAASVAPRAIGQEQQRALGFTYGRRKDLVNAYVLSADVGALRLQAGIVDVVDDSDQATVVGAGYSRTLWQSQSAGPVGSVGFSGEAGYGRIEDASAYSLGIKAPLAMTFSGTGFAVSPYVAPGFYFGGVSADGESENGERATMNAGVQFALPIVRLELGAHKVFIEDSEITWGLGLSVSWR